MGQPFRLGSKCLWAAHRRKIRKRVIETHGMTCWLCELPIATTEEVTMDHVVSARDGGLFRADNLRPAHDECNRLRGYEELRATQAPSPEPRKP